MSYLVHALSPAELPYCPTIQLVQSLAELEPVVKHVSAFVGKDCVAQNGDAMIQFGQGKVDFAGILRRLKRADFKGPIWIETCAIGETPAATTANAKANREFLERALATS